MDGPDEDVPLVEFMCLVFTRMPGLFVVLVLRISSGNLHPRVLIRHLPIS